MSTAIARQQTRDTHAQRVCDVGGVCEHYKRSMLTWREAVFLLQRIGLAREAAERLLELVEGRT